MSKRLLVCVTAALASLVVAAATLAQGPPPPNQVEPPIPEWNYPGAMRVPADEGKPAPRRDLTGLWEPSRGGIGARGARGTPAPLTAWGEQVSKTHHSGDGARMVPVEEINDPLSTMGDPGGFPRNLLFELRQVQFLQTPQAVFALHMWEKRWRVLWTTGRKLPVDPDPRWYGYSIARWEDDYTLVVNSNGTDERTWLDNAGNPHSDQLKVEERWHRVSANRLELTVTLDDPKAYTKPWVALEKLPFGLLPPDTDVMEMMNAASEVQAVAARFRASPEK